MFGMVAAAGIRILTRVDFRDNRFNLYIVALSTGFGLIPPVAPHWVKQMAHGLHPLLDSGILLTAVAAVTLNLFFNGSGEVTAADHGGAVAHLDAQGGRA
jgi:NCS2 family nucleobase:cation symporter-2